MVNHGIGHVYHAEPVGTRCFAKRVLLEGERISRFATKREIKGRIGYALSVEAVATADEAWDIGRLFAEVEYREQRRGGPRLE